jgi:redox-sensitive bicupin YhaK (pirin superfamily)
LARQIKETLTPTTSFMKRILEIHTAPYYPIADLVTYTVMPSGNLMNIDPFLFLNHHGYQEYSPHNHGLPFGPHPHRGMETVTIILDGDIMHRDSTGNESVIEAGGVQWMTAGRGVLHAEVSSDEFKRTGGPLEILQLWTNLPSRLKMTEPRYIGLQKDKIPAVVMDDGKVTVNVIAGDWQQIPAAFSTLVPLTLRTVFFEQGGKLSVDVAHGENVLLYVIRGEVLVNGSLARMHQLVQFERDGIGVSMEAQADSIVLFGHAVPLGEPVVAEGPFVMNTAEEIAEAYQDYRDGKFGRWK